MYRSSAAGRATAHVDASAPMGFAPGSSRTERSCSRRGHSVDGSSDSSAPALAHDFLQGGGEIGSLMRATVWSRTLLGSIEGWPQSLRTAVSILINSRYPMFVFWGPSLIQLYND